MQCIMDEMEKMQNIEFIIVFYFGRKVQSNLSIHVFQLPKTLVNKTILFFSLIQVVKTNNEIAWAIF